MVEDAPFIMEVLSQLIEKLGAEVVGRAESGLSAVELAQRLNPDVIFMDLVLPELNGIQAAERILAHQKAVKIVACSTLDSEEVMLEALAVGCIDYIKKPFTKADLQKVLEKLDSSSKTEKSSASHIE